MKCDSEMELNRMHASQSEQKYFIVILYRMRKIYILSVLISVASSFSLILAKSLDPWKYIQQDCQPDSSEEEGSRKQK